MSESNDNGRLTTNSAIKDKFAAAFGHLKWSVDFAKPFIADTCPVTSAVIIRSPKALASFPSFEEIVLRMSRDFLRSQLCEEDDEFFEHSFAGLFMRDGEKIDFTPKEFSTWLDDLVDPRKGSSYNRIHLDRLVPGGEMEFIPREVTHTFLDYHGYFSEDRHMSSPDLIRGMYASVVPAGISLDVRHDDDTAIVLAKGRRSHESTKPLTLWLVSDSGQMENLAANYGHTNDFLKESEGSYSIIWQYDGDVLRLPANRPNACYMLADTFLYAALYEDFTQLPCLATEALDSADMSATVSTYLSKLRFNDFEGRPFVVRDIIQNLGRDLPFITGSGREKELIDFLVKKMNKSARKCVFCKMKGDGIKYKKVKKEHHMFAHLHNMSPDQPGLEQIYDVFIGDTPPAEKSPPNESKEKKRHGNEGGKEVGEKQAEERQESAKLEKGEMSAWTEWQERQALW
ncbi:hypothetical protein ANO11243_052470 [Dothideomycetidae sp. 11243]|nr:hypothetical protein ANO11243_052470 [fungal sp. No.11243]